MNPAQRKQWIKAFFFLVGVALFVYLVVRIKPETILEYLSRVGWNFLWIAALAGFWNLCYSFAWKIFLDRLHPHLRLWDIFRFKVVGEAVSNITPLGWGGGDPVRIYLLRRQLPLLSGTASVVIDRILNNFAIAILLLSGGFLTFYHFSLPPGLRLGLPIACLLILLGCVVLYYRSRSGLFQFLLGIAEKIPFRKPFSPTSWEQAREMDQIIRKFYQEDRGKFLLALALHFLCRVCGVFEIYLASSFLHHPLSFLESYLLASTTVILNMLFIFIPGSFGVMEGAYAGIFALVKLDPAIGTAIQIIRRARMLLWTGIGFLFLAALKTKSPPQPVNPR